VFRRRRKKTFEAGSTDSAESIELDMSPMLSFMVTLIPIMLLSTVFVRITLIETQLPQIVQKAIEEDRNKKDREVNYYLSMGSDKTYSLEISQDGKTLSKMKIASNKNDFNRSQLHDELVKLKKQRPDIFRLNLKPNSEVAYDDIVKTIDEARAIKNKQDKVTITDKQTKEQAQTDVMFPDVVFSGIVEG